MTAASNTLPCAPHMFGHKLLGGFPGHEHSHPTGPQVCLFCGKTFDELVRAAESAAVEEGIKAGRASEREATGAQDHDLACNLSAALRNWYAGGEARELLDAVVEARDTLRARQ